MHNDAFSASHGEFDAVMSILRTPLSVASYSKDSKSASQSTINEVIYEILEHQDLVNGHNLCFNRLCEATREAEALRQEDASLCSLNRELNENLSLMIQAAVQNRISSDDFVNRLGLCIGDEGAVGREVSSDLVESPMESPKKEVAGIQRVYPSKSVSVRSDGYLKLNQPGESQGGQTQTQNQTSPLSTMQQKVIVNGGKKEEDALKLAVYNLGMWKTELCMETGACSYSDHGQFAHGMEEFCPVISHPRYKTEAHRMLTSKYKHKHQQTRYSPYQLKHKSTLPQPSRQASKEEDTEEDEEDDEQRRVREGKKNVNGRPERKPPIGIDLALTYYPSNNEELENLTVHGGWPRGSGIRRNASMHPRGRMKETAPKYYFNPDDETERLMHQYWSSTDDKTDEEFWAHEWVEHGTCAKEFWTCDEYFNWVLNTGIEIIEGLRRIMNSLTHGQVIDTRNFYQVIIDELGVRPFLDIKNRELEDGEFSNVPELNGINFLYNMDFEIQSYTEEECEMEFENFTVVYRDIE